MFVHLNHKRKKKCLKKCDDKKKIHFNIQNKMFEPLLNVKVTQQGTFEYTLPLISPPTPNLPNPRANHYARFAYTICIYTIFVSIKSLACVLQWVVEVLGANQGIILLWH